MVQSILVYSTLLIIMLFFALLIASKSSKYTTASGEIRNRKFWSIETIVPIFLFAIVFGLRYDVGVDHLNYLEGYIKGENIGKGEFLFDSITNIGIALNMHATIYFAILAFIQISFFLLAFKNERYLFPYLIFFFFTMGDWLFWMNGIRQALAMCIWFYSIKYISEKKLFKYLIYCLAAVLFHKSALILIAFYPLLRTGKDYFRQISLQLILFLLAFVFNKYYYVIFPKLEVIVLWYAEVIGGDSYTTYGMDRLESSVSNDSGSGMFYLFKIFLTMIIIFYSKKLKSFYNTNHFTVLYFFFFFGTITFYMFPVGLVSITRPFQYFNIFHCVMFAYFLNYLYWTSKDIRQRKMINIIIFYGVIVAFIGAFYLNLITSEKNDSIWYQYFFDQNFSGYPRS